MQWDNSQVICGDDIDLCPPSTQDLKLASTLEGFVRGNGAGSAHPAEALHDLPSSYIGLQYDMMEAHGISTSVRHKSNHKRRNDHGRL